MKILTDKQFMHIVKSAGRSCRDYYAVKAELDEVKHERDLARAMAEGFKALAESQEKETFRYKSMYEKQLRKNKRQLEQNGKLYQRVLELSGGESDEADI